MIPAVDGVCEECGFDYDSVPDAEVSDRLVSYGRRYRAPLTRGLPGESLSELLRAHPTPGVWSALEYACHMRDVFVVQRERAELTLVEDTPTYQPMGREERVVDDRYNEQDPLAVLDELAANAEECARTFESLTPDQWLRTAIYTYPEPAERPLTWLARHTIHEAHHHLLDIGRALRTARGR